MGSCHTLKQHDAALQPFPPQFEFPYPVITSGLMELVWINQSHGIS